MKIIQNPKEVVSWLKDKNLNEKIHPKTKVKIENWSNNYNTWQSNFRFSVTPYYLSLVDWQNEYCPILKQILPQAEELIKVDYEEWDSLAEEKFMPIPGLTHRYPDRVLWYITHNCSVYCRFCTRKRKVSNANSAPKKNDWDKTFNYIKENISIKEVILSGGDPLSLSDSNLDFIISNLKKYKHLFSIRIHTRMPVTNPDRITKNFVKILKKFFPITMVTHFNHAIEITPQTKSAIKLLKMAGVSVLNQSVLLKDINDSIEAQTDLNLGLIKIGVIPYYLHRCDEIPGTNHFRVPISKGLEILKNMRGRNPGFALPRFMIDLPKGGGKIPVIEEDYIGENYIIDKKKNQIIIKNWEGKLFTINEKN